MGTLARIGILAGILALLPIGTAAVACDLDRGKRVYAKCAICHSRDMGAPAVAGPNLHGVLGRLAGTAPGFTYSRALRGFDRRWTREELDRFLAAPTTTVPGTTMAFAGLRNAADRAAVICLLERPEP